jgi:hypothetical protein
MSSSNYRITTVIQLVLYCDATFMPTTRKHLPFTYQIPYHARLKNNGETTMDSRSTAKQEYIKSRHSNYQYPKFPTTCSDFIPELKKAFSSAAAEKQTTLMLKDMWAALQGLVAIGTDQAYECFLQTIMSVPENEQSLVRTAKLKTNRLLIDPLLFFADQIVENPYSPNEFITDAIENKKQNFLDAVFMKAHSAIKHGEFNKPTSDNSDTQAKINRATSLSQANFGDLGYWAVICNQVDFVKDMITGKRQAGDFFEFKKTYPELLCPEEDTRNLTYLHLALNCGHEELATTILSVTGANTPVARSAHEYAKSLELSDFPASFDATEKLEKAHQTALDRVDGLVAQETTKQKPIKQQLTETQEQLTASQEGNKELKNTLNDAQGLQQDISEQLEKVVVAQQKLSQLAPTGATPNAIVKPVISNAPQLTNTHINSAPVSTINKPKRKHSAEQMSSEERVSPKKAKPSSLTSAQETQEASPPGKKMLTRSAKRKSLTPAGSPDSPAASPLKRNKETPTFSRVTPPSPMKTSNNPSEPSGTGSHKKARPDNGILASATPQRSSSSQSEAETPPKQPPTHRDEPLSSNSRPTTETTSASSSQATRPQPSFLLGIQNQKIEPRKTTEQMDAERAEKAKQAALEKEATEKAKPAKTSAMSHKEQLAAKLRTMPSNNDDMQASAPPPQHPSPSQSVAKTLPKQPPTHRDEPLSSNSRPITETTSASSSQATRPQPSFLLGIQNQNKKPRKTVAQMDAERAENAKQAALKKEAAEKAKETKPAIAGPISFNAQLAARFETMRPNMAPESPSESESSSGSEDSFAP